MIVATKKRDPGWWCVSMRKNASDARKGFADAVRRSRMLAQSSLSQVHMRQRNLHDSTPSKRDCRLPAYKADVGLCLCPAERANDGGLGSHLTAAGTVVVSRCRLTRWHWKECQDCNAYVHGPCQLSRVLAAAVRFPCRSNAMTRTGCWSCDPATQFC